MKIKSSEGVEISSSETVFIKSSSVLKGSSSETVHILGSEEEVKEEIKEKIPIKTSEVLKKVPEVKKEEDDEISDDDDGFNTVGETFAKLKAINKVHDGEPISVTTGEVTIWYYVSKTEEELISRTFT